jgi:hypothetical protein
MNLQPIIEALGPQVTLTMMQLLFDENQKLIMHNAWKLLHEQPSNGHKTMIINLPSEIQ